MITKKEYQSFKNSALEASKQSSLEYLNERLRCIDELLYGLEGSRDSFHTAAIRKKILGLKACRIETLEEIKEKKIKINAGDNLKRDHSGNLSEREKTVIKVAIAEIKKAQKSYKEDIKWLARGRDDDGVLVKKYVAEAKRIAGMQMSKARNNSRKAMESISKEIKGYEDLSMFA